MILDDFLVFFDNVSVTANGQIGDVIDRTANAPTLAQFGPGYAGMPLYLVIQTGTAFNGNGGAMTSLTASLVSDSTADLNTSRTTHVSSASYAVADLTANKVLAVLPVPPGDYERFIGVRLVTTGSSGTPSAGTLRAFLTNTPGQWQALAANNPAAWTNPSGG